MPLLPAPLVYFCVWLIGARKTVISIIKDGQLCFYCTSLLAACIDDVVKSKSAIADARGGLAVAALIICLIVSTFTYGVATISDVRSEANTLQPPATLPRADEVKLGITSIATSILTTLIVMFVRYVLGLNA